MPNLFYPIGTRVHHSMLGDATIIGQKNPHLPNYHLYFHNSHIRLFKRGENISFQCMPNSDMTASAQNIILGIQTNPPPSYAKLKRGTILVNHKNHLPDMEYIILDNGHIRQNGSVHYLEAFREIGKETWFIDYFDEPDTTTTTPFITIHQPTPDSIKQANILLFEHVIAPAFTTF